MSSFIYKNLFRPLLFQIEPERAHELTLGLLTIVGAVRPLRWLVQQFYGLHRYHSNPVEAFGLRFPNPVGLAAGYDKDGVAWRGLSALGFGHIEIGTVTPQPQIGNPRPRVFRLPEEQGLINRMGFPGRGAEFVYNQLSKLKVRKSPILLGVNIGKNKDTPNLNAAQDYVYLLRKFSPVADYLTVNISSPNTVGLRRLQAREFLEDLLDRLNKEREKLANLRPILVKISPDLSREELDDALGVILGAKMDGIVATNTTIHRDQVHSKNAREAGGLSGRPLSSRSRELISIIYKSTGGEIPIIGVGGIMNPDDARAMLDAGAVLIQLYTGLVYYGPGLVKRILYQRVD